MDSNVKDRLTAIVAQIATARQELEEVRNDMMATFDEKPTTWQESEVGEQMDMEINELTDVVDALENAESDLADIAAAAGTNQLPDEGAKEK